jgi:hypothetical protein
MHRQIEIPKQTYSRKFKQIKDYKNKFESESTINKKPNNKLPDTIGQDGNY